MKRLPIAILTSCLLCTLVLGGLRVPDAAAQEAQQVGIVIHELSYDPNSKIYDLSFGVTNPERVGMVIVHVVDGNATNVARYNIELNMSPTAKVEINGKGFTPGGEYTIQIPYWKVPTPVSASNATNWYTDNEPDLLLFECLHLACLYVQDDAGAAKWRAKADVALMGVKDKDCGIKWSGEPLTMVAQ